MAVKLTTTGSGSVGDIQTGWSVTENSTSVNPTDSGGGTGSVSLSAKANKTSRFVIDNNAQFTHELGTISGTVGNISVTSIGVGMSIAPIVSLLSVDRTMPPTGNQPLSEIIAGYVGAVTEQLTVNYQATNNPSRVYIGWTGDVWYHINQLCAINKVEIVISGSSLIVRDLGVTALDLTDSKNVTTALSTQGTGLNVNVVNHNAKLVPSLGGNRYNFSVNPSVETNATNWDAIAPLATITKGRVASTLIQGAYAYRVELVTLNPPLYLSALNIHHTNVDVSTVASGELCSVSMSVYYAPGATRVSMVGYPLPIAALQVAWYSGGVLMSGYGSSSGLTGIPFNQKTTFTIGNMVKPPGADTARVTVWFPYGTDGAGDEGETPNLIDGDTVYADAVMFTNGSLAAYGDGSFPGWSWSGAANNSTSFIPTPVENDFYNALREDNTIYSVATGETIRTTIQNDNHPTFLAQPRQSATLPIGIGQYYVTGQNGVAVTPNAWDEFGGKVSVAIGTIPGTMDLVINGPMFDIPGVPGPYILGYVNGETKIAAFTVAGIGVVTDPETVRLGTGANPANTTNDVATSLDSPFISNRTAMYDASSWMTVDGAGPIITLTATVGTHQLAGFGLTPGALIRYQDSIYRVSSVNIGSAETTINAKWYVVANELDNRWSGQTAGEFDTAWSGYLAGDIQVAPLQKVV